jgi:hypothetical protein
VAVMPFVFVRRRAFRGLPKDTRITGCRIQRVWLRHVLQVGDYHLFVVLIGVGWCLSWARAMALAPLRMATAAVRPKRRRLFDRSL